MKSKNNAFGEGEKHKKIATDLVTQREAGGLRKFVAHIRSADTGFNIINKVQSENEKAKQSFAVATYHKGNMSNIAKDNPDIASSVPNTQAIKKYETTFYQGKKAQADANNYGKAVSITQKIQEVLGSNSSSVNTTQKTSNNLRDKSIAQVNQTEEKLKEIIRYNPEIVANVSDKSWENLKVDSLPPAPPPAPTPPIQIYESHLTRGLNSKKVAIEDYAQATNLSALKGNGGLGKLWAHAQSLDTGGNIEEKVKQLQYTQKFHKNDMDQTRAKLVEMLAKDPKLAEEVKTRPSVLNIEEFPKFN
jgi:hypothetical protein